MTKSKEIETLSKMSEGYKVVRMRYVNGSPQFLGYAEPTIYSIGHPTIPDPKNGPLSYFGSLHEAAAFILKDFAALGCTTSNFKNILIFRCWVEPSIRNGLWIVSEYGIRLNCDWFPKVTRFAEKIIIEYPVWKENAIDLFNIAMTPILNGLSTDLQCTTHNWVHGRKCSSCGVFDMQFDAELRKKPNKDATLHLGVGGGVYD